MRLLLRSGVALDGIDDAFRRLGQRWEWDDGDYVPEARHHYTMSRNLICDVRTAGGLRKSRDERYAKAGADSSQVLYAARRAPGQCDDVPRRLPQRLIAWKILSYWRTEIYCDDGLLFIDRLSDESVEAMLWTENAGLARPRSSDGGVWWWQSFPMPHPRPAERDVFLP